MYELLLFSHIIGACVLLGTGAGIAFFMLMAHRTDDPKLIAHTSSIVVVADTVFTATAAIAQPISGISLALITGWPILSGWIAASIALYVFIGLFWLPVVWIQIQLHRIAKAAVAQRTPLPPRYYKLYRLWFVCGFPAFAAILAIVWLMLTKPAFT